MYKSIFARYDTSHSKNIKETSLQNLQKFVIFGILFQVQDRHSQIVIKKKIEYQNYLKVFF